MTALRFTDIDLPVSPRLFSKETSALPAGLGLAGGPNARLLPEGPQADVLAALSQRMAKAGAAPAGLHWQSSGAMTSSFHTASRRPK